MSSPPHPTSPILVRARRGLAAAAIASAALACGALTPAAHAAPTTLSAEQAASPVAAWDGTVAWSHYDAATKQYHLVVSRNGGQPQAVPVAPSPVPFDVDLGTNTQGSTTAVYTRCTTPGSVQNGKVRPGTGCDIYRTILSTGSEQRITKLSSPGADERDPTTFRGEIAFIRRERHGGRSYDVLRTGDTHTGSKGSRALVKVRATRSSGLRGAELSWNRIAYVRTAAGRYGFGQQDVHVRTLRSGHDRTVYRALSGGANGANVTRPSLTEDLKAFVWARTNNGSGRGNRLVRYDTHTARLRYAKGSSRSFSSGWASRTLGMAVLDDRSGTGSCVANVDDTPDRSQCTVKLTGPVSFNTKP